MNEAAKEPGQISRQKNSNKIPSVEDKQRGEELFWVHEQNKSKAFLRAKKEKAEEMFENTVLGMDHSLVGPKSVAMGEQRGKSQNEIL